MSTQMTVEEREAYLAGLHVGVMSVERADGPPLAVPIWYGYESGGEVVTVMDGESLKYRLLTAAGRFSLCAQDEGLPYKYVTVEGPISSTSDGSIDDIRALAHRYLGDELGESYTESSSSERSRRVTMRPDRWFTVDYGKMDTPEA